MIKELRDFLQSVVNKDYEELRDMAKIVLVQSYGILKKYGDEKAATVTVSVFLVSVLAADGELSANERRLVRDLFGDDTVLKLVGAIDAQTYAKMNQIVDNLPNEEKAVLCHLAILVAAVDGKMDSNELSYIEDLLA